VVFTSSAGRIEELPEGIKGRQILNTPHGNPKSKTPVKGVLILELPWLDDVRTCLCEAK